MRESNFLFPRVLLTFNDGGAFPEIHAVAQYPRHMGNPRVKHTSLPVWHRQSLASKQSAVTALLR